MEIVEQISDGRQGNEVKGRVAGELARARHFDRALALANEIDGWTRSSAMYHIAIAMASIGEHDLAEETAFKGDAQLIRVIKECANLQAAEGDQTRARASFTRAVAAVHSRSNRDPAQEGYYVDLELCEIAESQVEAGLTEDARQTFLLAREAGLRCMAAAQTMTDHQRSLGADSLKWVAEKQARAGHIEDAIETVEIMRTRQMIWHRQAQKTKEGEALVEIVIALAARGLFQAAYASASQIEPQDVHANALKHLALAEARAERSQQARSHLDEAISVLFPEEVHEKYKPQVVECLVDLAIAYRDIGSLESSRATVERALEVSHGIANEDYRSRALQAVALAQAKLEDFSGSAQTIRDIVMEHNRRWAQRDVAALQARAGLTVEAVRTAEGALFEREKVLEELAQVFAEIGDREGLHRLLIPCAAESGSAYRLSLMLAKVYPEQLLELTDAVVGAAPS